MFDTPDKNLILLLGASTKQYVLSKRLLVLIKGFRGGRKPLTR